MPDSECQKGHHPVTQGELHNCLCGIRGHVDKVLWGQCNAHGQHESRQCGSKVLGGEPCKGLGALESNAGKENGPNGKESGGDIGRLFVGGKYLLSQSRRLNSSTAVVALVGTLFGSSNYLVLWMEMFGKSQMISLVRRRWEVQGEVNPMPFF
jgi:hypothetical protein